jgi:hypothetical protein
LTIDGVLFVDSEILTAASKQDSVAAIGLLGQVAAEHPGTQTLSAQSEAMIHIAMTDLMARHPTNENTTSWHEPTPRTKRQIQDEMTG